VSRGHGWYSRQRPCGTTYLDLVDTGANEGSQRLKEGVHLAVLATADCCAEEEVGRRKETASACWQRASFLIGVIGVDPVSADPIID
jgi:hypothetical protein